MFRRISLSLGIIAMTLMAVGGALMFTTGNNPTATKEGNQGGIFATNRPSGAGNVGTQNIVDGWSVAEKRHYISRNTIYLNDTEGNRSRGQTALPANWRRYGNRPAAEGATAYSVRYRGVQDAHTGQIRAYFPRPLSYTQLQSHTRGIATTTAFATMAQSLQQQIVLGEELSFALQAAGYIEYLELALQILIIFEFLTPAQV